MFDHRVAIQNGLELIVFLSSKVVLQPRLGGRDILDQHGSTLVHCSCMFIYYYIKFGTRSIQQIPNWVSDVATHST